MKTCSWRGQRLQRRNKTKTMWLCVNWALTKIMHTESPCRLSTLRLPPSARPSWFMGNVTASSMTPRRYSMSDPWYPDTHTQKYTQAGAHPSLVGIWVAMRRSGGFMRCPWGWLAESCQTIMVAASRGPHSPLKSISINAETQYYQMSSPARPSAFCSSKKLFLTATWRLN